MQNFYGKNTSELWKFVVVKVFLWTKYLTNSLFILQYAGKRRNNKYFRHSFGIKCDLLKVRLFDILRCEKSLYVREVHLKHFVLCIQSYMYINSLTLFLRSVSTWSSCSAWQASMSGVAPSSFGVCRSAIFVFSTKICRYLGSFTRTALCSTHLLWWSATVDFAPFLMSNIA